MVQSSRVRRDWVYDLFLKSMGYIVFSTSMFPYAYWVLIRWRRDYVMNKLFENEIILTASLRLCLHAWQNRVNLSPGQSSIYLSFRSTLLAGIDRIYCVSGRTSVIVYSDLIAVFHTRNVCTQIKLQVILPESSLCDVRT